MTGLRRFWPIWLGALSGVAGAGLFGNVRWRQPDQSRISHARHIKAEVECIACHESVYDATDLTAHHLPKEAKCLECHRKQKESGNCAFCHSNPADVEPKPKLEPKVKFNHSTHIDFMDERCTLCHTDLPEPGVPAKPPKMTACFQSCHDGTHNKNPHQASYDKGECSTCHLDLWMNPLKPKSVYAHEGDFLHDHPLAARSSGAACSQCHDQSFCSECHARTVATGPDKLHFDRVDRAFVHRANFLAVHPTEANANPASCERCHTLSSCESCHTSKQVGAAATNPRSPHPQGWALPGSSDFHGDAARQDIGSCAVCHDHGGRSDCVSCHKVGGIGGDPHPPSFESRHRTVDRANPMCLECHL